MKTIIQNIFQYNKLQKNIHNILGLGLVLFAISCSSSPKVVNNYYINGKKVDSKNLPNQQITQNDSTQQGNNSTETWVNPLNNNTNNANNTNNTTENNTNISDTDDTESVNIYGGNVVINNTPRYVNRNYVPVINPWWNNWSVISYSPFFGGGFGFGSPCVVYDWYSPWYNYHPYYGNSWVGRPSWGYWSWCSQPLYSYYPRRLNDNAYRNYNPYFDNYRNGNMSNRNNYGSRNESYGYSNNTIGNSRNNTTSIYKGWNSNSINNNQINSSSRNGVIKAGYVSEIPSSRNNNIYNSNNIDNNSVNSNNSSRNGSPRNIYGGNSGSVNTDGNIDNSRNGTIRNSGNNNNSSRNNNTRNSDNNDIFKSRDNKPAPINNTPVRPPANNDVIKGSRNSGGNTVNPMPSRNASPPVAAPSNNGGSSRNGRR